MVTSEVTHCKTLEEFYASIRLQQEAAHGPEYCHQHDAITRLMSECDTYKELGTHQGATAAAACLTNPKRVELVDITMEKYNKSKHLFEEYCAEHGINLVVKETDSTIQSSVSACDLLLVDSYHHPAHLAKELAIHADSVSKYMVFHDTVKPTDRLYQYLVQFTSGISRWDILEHHPANVGFTVLKRSV